MLNLPTERGGVTLKQLATPEDDRAYWNAVEANRDHLNQLGDATSQKYQQLEDVTDARLNAGSKLRMGIWDEDTFVGSINATPKNDEVEIGYWLDSRYTGKGYATLAVQAFTAYLRPQFRRVFAEVHVDNLASAKVLERSGYASMGEIDRKWGRAVIFEVMAGAEA